MNVKNCGDYWEIITSWYRYGAMTGENVYFTKGVITNIYFYQNGDPVGTYMNGEEGYRYYVWLSNNNGTARKVYITKAGMMARLDGLGVKYTWLKYLKHEN
jgi:hypothetical protein